jgi:hypothetical protein
MDLVASMSVMGMEYAPYSSWFDLAWLDLIPTLFKLFKADKVIWDILHKVCQNSGYFTCNYDLQNDVSTYALLPKVTRFKTLCNALRLHSIIESSNHVGEMIKSSERQYILFWEAQSVSHKGVEVI